MSITRDTTSNELASIVLKLSGNEAESQIISGQAIDGEYIIDHSENEIVKLGIRNGIAYKLKVKSSPKKEPIIDVKAILFWRNLDSATLGNSHPNRTRTLGESTIDENTQIPLLKLSHDTLFPSKKSKIDKVYVRDCYEKLYNLIEGTQRDRATTLIYGNPGIGKSMFAFYYLYKKRTDKSVKSIIYDVVNALNVYHFTYDANEEPVVYIGNRESFRDIRTETNNSSIYIVDGQQPQPSNIFTLIISSPRKSNYEEYMKDGVSNRFVMPLWSPTEIISANHLIFNHPDEDVEERYFEWGGVPRYVLEKITSSDQNELITAIASTDMKACIQSINAPDSPATGSHKVILVDAKPGSGFIEQCVTFASNFVKDKMIQRFYSNWREDVINKVSVSGLDHIGGLIFEQLSHQTFRHGSTFLIRPLGSNTELGNELRFTPSAQESIKSTKDLESRKKEKNYFPDSTYVKPLDLNFPAIDSFAGRYLFQMTKGDSHPVPFKEITKILYLLDPKLPPKEGTPAPLEEPSLSTTESTPESSSLTQFYLFFVVPQANFKDFRQQDYVNVTPVDPKDKSKGVTKTKVAQPPNLHQYALQMKFTSIDAAELYPVPR